MIREMIRDTLLAGDCDPVVTGTGEEGWEFLEREPSAFDAVVLDRTLPGIDGLEVLARIKDHGALDALPVILQTARAEREDVLAGLSAGAYYYLTKPFDAPTLQAIVRAAVRDHRNVRDLREQARRAIGAFSLLLRGAFSFRTLEEARWLATLAAQCTQAPEQVVLGLSELLVNAVEHGNLGIGYDDKSRLLQQDAWAGEVARRLDLPEYRDRTGLLEIDRGDDEIRFRIRDEGPGFDWRRYLAFAPERAFDTHGRGIALSRQVSFDRVEYLGSGNEVLAARAETRLVRQAGR